MLVSLRFAGDPVLQACLDGTHRMLPPESGPAVGKVQQALADLGFLPNSGIDSSFGGMTAAAVSAFKQAQGIEPSDGVVGPKTMAALDGLFADELPPPPPPVPPPPPPDQFGRRPAGAARLPAALTTVAAFAAKPTGSNWLHLDRAAVAAGITAAITVPDSVQQGGNGLCTEAAFANIWAQDAPDAYASFATALYDNGSANLAPVQGGGTRITPSAALLGADYGAIASRMSARHLPVPSQADWMVLSAIRDSSNVLFNFTGDPDDWVSHAIGDGAELVGEPADWMRGAAAWISVVDQTNALLTASLDHAKSLDPSRSRCVLRIDVAMLMNDTGKHTVVLRAPVTEAADGSIDLQVWTWGGVRPVHVSKQTFESSYFGACIGFF